ncbi:hypothetical protein L1987_51144 [Smallanthus sonchifolius]|uniref:Uncharacterized protein n=1 Tax=Smallanthus sonchifolius TaxID=185202 RepID=A0ACB9EQ43_9ASTR|nr:hypothetical protein L1987_51144 [Smallanthus sonchifolius]
MRGGVFRIDRDRFVGVFGGGFGEFGGGGAVSGGSGFGEEIGAEDEVALGGVAGFVSVTDFVEEVLGDVEHP